MKYLANQSHLLPIYMDPDIVLSKATIGNYKSTPLFPNTWNVADWFLNA